MRLIVFFLSFFICLSGIANAQDFGAKTKKGDGAILFQFNGFANLATGGIGAVETPVDASGSSVVVINGVGGKFYFDDQFALRGAITFSRESVSQETVGAIAAFDETSTSLGFEAGIEIHLHAKRLSPYFGGLIGYSYGSFSRMQGGSEARASRSGYGIAGILGAEFFLFEQVSLAAEYRAVFQSKSGSNVLSSGTSIDAPSETTLGIYSQGFITLGLYLW